MSLLSIMGILTLMWTPVSIYGLLQEWYNTICSTSFYLTNLNASCCSTDLVINSFNIKFGRSAQINPQHLQQFISYVSLFHSLMVLSFSNAADAMMFSVGWQEVQRTTSETNQQSFLIWNGKSGLAIKHILWKALF